MPPRRTAVARARNAAGILDKMHANHVAAPARWIDVGVNDRAGSR